MTLIKTTTAGTAVHEFSANLYKGGRKKCKISRLLGKYYKYQLGSFSDPFCYNTLRNYFHKSTTSIKVITSINSKINMYQFLKDELSADYL